MRRAGLGLALLLTILPLAACETDTPTAEESAALRPVIKDFLVKLAASYREMTPAPLEGVAAPKMMAQVRHDIEMLRAGGDRLDPEMKSIDITDLRVIRHANAYANVTETWDTKRFDSVTGQLVGHNPDSVLHSHVQLKKIEGTWYVIYREVEETATGPRLIVPSPTPD